MKNLVLAAVLALSAMPVTSMAAATTTGNGDPMAVMQSWGLTGRQSKIVAAGTVIYNRAGKAFDVCPTWYRFGCVDLVGIKY